MNDLTQAGLREILHYDPETGFFTWIKKTTKKVVVGRGAGSIDPRGYVQIKIFGKVYLAHRLAWLYVHGDCQPKLDHRDTTRTHNWIGNLRPATQSQNNANMRRPRHNTSGRKGVSWVRAAEKWGARIQVQGRQIHLGFFARIDEASAAYARASQKYFGTFGRTE